MKGTTRARTAKVIEARRKIVKEHGLETLKDADAWIESKKASEGKTRSINEYFKSSEYKYKKKD